MSPLFTPSGGCSRYVGRQNSVPGLIFAANSSGRQLWPLSSGCQGCSAHPLCSALLSSCLSPSSSLASTSISALETVLGSGGASGELLSSLTVTPQLLGALSSGLRGCSWTVLGISRSFIHCGLPGEPGQAVLPCSAGVSC